MYAAFLVAWGGVATQTARIVGIFALLLELRGLGVPNLEYYSSLAVLFIEMGDFALASKV